MRPASIRGVPKAFPGACREPSPEAFRPKMPAFSTSQNQRSLFLRVNYRSGTTWVDRTCGPPTAPSSMTRTTTWSALVALCDQ
jgi:hypothetical protein